MGEEFDVAVRSHRLHARRFGPRSAPLVVGLPGLSGNMRNFDFLGERMGDGLQLVALDLRGRGKSEATPPGTYGWESHALDVLAVAQALGFETFSVVGQSMGGSVAMKVAELDGAKVAAVVLVDIAGRVDRGVGAVIEAVRSRLDGIYPSADHYLDAVRALGLAEPWNEYWERCYRYELETANGGVRPGISREAVDEDRAYARTQHPYQRWRHLAMPTLLLRAIRELRPGSGYVVPVADRDRFRREVPSAAVVEVAANHLTINTHPETAEAIRNFLMEAKAR